MDIRRMKIVYVVLDRNSRRNSSRIGVAFVEADGSMNVKLDAIPLSGELQIRDYVPREPPAARDDPAARDAPSGAHAIEPEPLGPEPLERSA
jgi:hypothetical protein